MSINIHFEVNTIEYTVLDERISYDYSYWKPLMSVFLSASDEIQIHCWSSDQDVLDELYTELSTELTFRAEHNMLIFSGKLTKQVKKYIITDYLTPSKRLKWFSVFLSKHGHSTFNAEHYGTEFIGYKIDTSTLEEIKKILPKEISVNTWVSEDDQN
ncbi:MAG: hypothetical protein AB2374_05040 [Cytobacillus gottheilii]|uniref:hypothetical protein n=1 Tax=Cytobacillus gottheilii TaxID=859144 RepID=UPI003464AC0C